MNEDQFRYIQVDYDPFEGPEIQKTAPATEPQKEVFFSILVGGADANRAYNESFSLYLNGTLHVTAFRQAFAELLQRHEALRSTISANGEKMVIYTGPLSQLVEKDISQLSSSEQQVYIRNLLDQEATHQFDLVRGPLVHACLVKMSETSWQFVLTAHHLVLDSWSTGILLEDLSKLYTAHRNSRLPILPEAASFAQYANEEAGFIRTDDYRQSRDYWTGQFSKDLPFFDFPTDFKRPDDRTYRSQRMDFPVDPALTDRLKQAGTRNGCSFITTLIAAFELFLYRVSGQADLVFGLPTAGQAASGYFHLVGHCVNLLPIRSRPDASLSFMEYLLKRKAAILDHYEHQRLSFGNLLKELNIARDASRMPLVPVAFNVDLGITDSVSFEGLTYRFSNHPRHYELFDFFLNVSGSETRMVFEWTFNTQLFRPSTIQQWHRDFEAVLQDLSDHPDKPIRNLPGITEPVADPAVYQQLNATTRAYPADRTVDQLITATAGNHPSAIAVHFEQATLTYAALETQANQFARFLLDNGVKPGDTVGLSLDRSLYLPVAILGIMKAGATFQPIDPAYPVQRIRFILEDGGAVLLITAAQHRNRFETDIKTIFLEFIVPVLKRYDASVPESTRSSNDLIYILHTSGSTGKPKGVLITHRNVVNLLLSMQQTPGLVPADRLLSVTSISFDIFYLELFLPLVTGATMYLINSTDTRDAREIVRTIHKEGISVLQATPSFWSSIIALAEDRPLPVKALSGGEALSRDLARRMLPKVKELWNVYGPTETTIWAATKRITAQDDLITIGKPLFNTRFYILDAGRQLLPPGKTGEIYIAGDNVGLGYLNRPELTDERFLPDTICGRTGETMYQTGDLGKLLENGELQCLGRVDQQIKLNGFRIEPEEIEYWMAQADPGIQQIVVMPVTRKNTAQLAAFYTQETTAAQWTKTGWKDYLKAHLPAYMIPEHYVQLDQFPLTPNGKIDKKELTLPEQPAGSTPPDNGPVSPIEATVLEIWSRALQNDQLGLDDNFFEAGGHSLIAARVMQQLYKVTGKKLPLSTLFQNETARRLAAVIGNEKETVRYQSLVPIKTGGKKPPLLVVHGAGMNVLMLHPLAKHLPADQPFYGIQGLGLDGKPIEASTIEEIAGQYAQEIQATLPVAAYAILGYSMGGIIGLELAKQLKAAGKKIILLGMIDSYLGTGPYRQAGLQQKLLRQPRKLGFIVSNLLEHPAETLGYQWQVLKSKLQQATGKPPAGKEEATVEDGIQDHYDKAVLLYEPSPYDEPIYLFRVMKRIYYIDDRQYLGWKPYAPRGIEIIDLPGDHQTFLLPPNDRFFAEKLQVLLEKLSPLL